MVKKRRKGTMGAGAYAEGERVVLIIRVGDGVEKNHVGTVTKIGKKGYHVEFDRAPRGHGSLWLPASKLKPWDDMLGRPVEKQARPEPLTTTLEEKLPPQVREELRAKHAPHVAVRGPATWVREVPAAPPVVHANPNPERLRVVPQAPPKTEPAQPQHVAAKKTEEKSMSEKKDEQVELYYLEGEYERVALKRGAERHAALVPGSWWAPRVSSERQDGTTRELKAWRVETILPQLPMNRVKLSRLEYPIVTVSTLLDTWDLVRPHANAEPHRRTREEGRKEPTRDRVDRLEREISQLRQKVARLMLELGIKEG